MPVPLITYLYIILVLADVMCIPVAIVKRDYPILHGLLFALPWLLIGLSFHYNVCPFIFCAG